MLNRFMLAAAVLACLIPSAAFGQAPGADQFSAQGQFDRLMTFEYQTPTPDPPKTVKRK